MIDRFISFKEPVVIDDVVENGILVRKGGMIFRGHVVLTDGRHFSISDAQHGQGGFAVDETLVFQCDEEGHVTDWEEAPWGGRGMRTEAVVVEMNRT